MSRSRPDIPRRQLVTLVAYLETGSHAAAAHRLGISESTSKQRVSAIIRALGVHNAAQAMWVLRGELEAEREARVKTRPVLRTRLKPPGRMSDGTSR
jgi:hypothetical protein